MALTWAMQTITTTGSNMLNVSQEPVQFVCFLSFIFCLVDSCLMLDLSKEPVYVWLSSKLLLPVWLL